MSERIIPIDDEADILAGLRPPEGGETRYVIDGWDGHGHPRYIPVPAEGPLPDAVVQALPDPRGLGDGPETLHDATLEEIRRRERRAG